MVSLDEICTLLHALLQVDLFQDVCPNGLQVEGRQEVTAIATAVTASLHAIEEAVNQRASLLLVHHGIFWNRESPLLTGTRRKKVLKLLEKEISLMAYHLPLDAHPEFGNNFRAARDLGMKDLRPFQKIGVIGEFSSPIAVEEFQRSVDRYYGNKSQAQLEGAALIQKVAILSGSGYRELLAAKKAGAHLFITGSVDEPVYHTAKEEKIHFLSVGHAASEKVGPKALGEFISNRFSIPHHFIDEKNPY